MLCFGCLGMVAQPPAGSLGKTEEWHCVAMWGRVTLWSTFCHFIFFKLYILYVYSNSLGIGLIMQLYRNVGSGNILIILIGICYPGIYMLEHMIANLLNTMFK